MAARHTSTIVIIATTWLGVAAHVSAQMFVPTGRQTLRGLPGIEVQMEAFEPDLEADGLKRATVQADVEQQLRSGGIVVYPSQNANPSDAKAYLYVLISSIKIPGQAQYAISLQVHLRQMLKSLVTSTSVVNAMTWDRTDVMVVRTADLVQVRDVIRESIDEFVSDWKAVH